MHEGAGPVGRWEMSESDKDRHTDKSRESDWNGGAAVTNTKACNFQDREIYVKTIILLFGLFLFSFLDSAI